MALDLVPVAFLQVFFCAGLIAAVLQLVVFPRVIKVLGVTVWQRTGCLLAISAFLAVPCSEVLSWDDNSLFLISVVNTAFVYCSMAMVKANNHSIASHT